MEAGALGGSGHRGLASHLDTQLPGHLGPVPEARASLTCPSSTGLVGQLSMGPSEGSRSAQPGIQKLSCPGGKADVDSSRSAPLWSRTYSGNPWK